MNLKWLKSETDKVHLPKNGECYFIEMPKTIQNYASLHRYVMKNKTISYISLLLLPFFLQLIEAEEIRVATFNIKWLSDIDADCGVTKVKDVRTQGDRLEKLIAVIKDLDADIIGLQEIKSREALELIFESDELRSQGWTIVIDDDSAQCQKLAMAVREPYTVKGAINRRLDAEPGDFLFPDHSNNSFFPRDRDVLSCTIQGLETQQEIQVLVHHAKARVGGRIQTDQRRAGAARKIVEKIQAYFDDEYIILLGDFNDNHDDASANILETGLDDQGFEMDDVDGVFLVNLTEDIGNSGHVSHGLNSNDINGSTIDTVDLQSRKRNKEGLTNDSYTGDILFDQIFISQNLRGHYVGGSIKVYNNPIAVAGNSKNRASDHLPVYAEFIFENVDHDDSKVLILKALPDPMGPDRGNEKVILANLTSDRISINGWTLEDAAGNEFALSGSILPSSEHQIDVPATMPLNNTGDTITLTDDQGNVIDSVRYTNTHVARGEFISF